MKQSIRLAFYTLKALLILLSFSLAGNQLYAQTDACTSPPMLTSSITCSPTAGSLTGAASFTGASINIMGCGSNNRNDVWYTFTAQTTNPTITLTVLTGMANARLQLFSGTCGSLNSVTCGNTSIAALGLSVGTVYYIRIYCTPNSTGTFTICVTDPPPANDLCASATALTSSVSCITTAGNMIGASYTIGSGAAACAGTDAYDVWYTFVAQSTNPTITVSGAGAGFIAPQVQLLSGTCGSFTSLGCGANTYAASGLTIGTTYYVRVYSTTAPVPTANGAFNICITDPPPANDLCSNAVSISSAASCTGTPGYLDGSTYTAIASVCGANNDVWYSFTAKTTNPTILITTAVANPRFQVYTAASCGGTVTSVTCVSSNTGTLSGLIVGASYLVRVYSNSNAIGPFSICITDPALPANDNCAGAIALTSAAACSNTTGDLLNSTGTAGVPGDCGAVGSPEVWYKYVATNAYPTITLSTLGADFTAAGSRIQLLSGSCGSWTSLACVGGLTLTPAGAGLSIGTTYYIRVFTNSAVMTGTAWGFKICITNAAAALPVVDYGKSYFNISKGTIGGTIEPGDTLEMRATFIVKSNIAYNVSVTGNIPANTSYVPNTMRILTNEGQLYKQWTDAADGDPATVSGSTVTINVGTGATQTNGGMIKSTDRPSLFGAQCLIVASYRVVVNPVSYGTIISIGGGNLSYSSSSGAVTNVGFPIVNAILYKNTGICANTVGSNGVLSEFGGTFGSGNRKDRVASTKVPLNYTDTVLTTGSPGDNYYGVSNNTSPRGANYSFNPNDPVAAHHIFNVWDIIGDHTGAASPTAGNPPADTTGGKTGGYMIVVNAAFRTDTAFLDTIKNLCPNTYYEYSAWFRNICKKCSGDSTGIGPTTAGYVPTGPGDTSGVHPNLTFNINGYDYYTTGDMGYTGQWIKKGFTYLTGPGQTQMIISIRNNAPGGGGNDWAMDDIGVATCTPNLAMNPSTPTVNVCYGDGASLSADVKSFFNNYTEYLWEKSADNGVTWTTTGYGGSGTPVFNGTDFSYTAVGPSFIGDSTTNLNIFRLRVASSVSNMADPNCSFSGIRTVQVFVNSCMWVLKADVTGINGQLKNNFSIIQWTTVNETGKTIYEIEKSTDGNHFTVIGSVNGNAQNGNGSYTFNDPEVLGATAYYRIKVKEEATFKYTKTVLLSPGKIKFDIKNLVNPFSNSVQFDVVLPGAGDIRATLFDNYGRVVKTYTMRQAGNGIIPFKMPNMGDLSSGIYTLKVDWQQESITKRIIKIRQ